MRWIERSGKRGAEVQLAAVPLDLAPLLRELLFDRVEDGRAHQRHAGGRRATSTSSRAGSGCRAMTRPVTVREILPVAVRLSERSACSGSRPTFPIRARTRRATRRPRSCGRSSTWPMPPTAACSSSSPATPRSSAAASSLRQALGGRWPLLVQGEAPRDQLLRRFREAGNAILLGTDSFWEGVDVPGRALRALVLSKLPFKVPSRAAHRGAAGAAGGAGGGRVHGLPAAARGAQAQAGVRPADPQPARRRGRGAARQPGRHQALRAAACSAGCRARSGSSAPWAQVRTKCEDFFARHGIGAPV